MSSSKFTARKPATYQNIVKFSVDELIKIIDSYETNVVTWRTALDTWEKSGKKGSAPVRPERIISFDVANEVKSEALKANSVRYLQTMLKDLTGKVRPLMKTITPTLTASWPKSKGEDEQQVGGQQQNPPNQTSFSTRILTNDEKALDAIADQRVNEKSPELPDDQFDAEATKQAALLKKEYLQWRVEKFISNEIEDMFTDPAERKKINMVLPPKTLLDVKGHVQFGRKPNVDNVDEMVQAESTDDGLIPLDQPMIHQRIKFDKNLPYTIWGKIYDITSMKRDPTNPKKIEYVLAQALDPATGRKMPLHGKTVSTWLRPKSLIFGSNNVQICISNKGLRIRVHSIIKELIVKQGAPQSYGPTVDDSTLDDIDSYGGQFGSPDIDVDMQNISIDAQSTSVVKPPGSLVPQNAKKLSDLEQQILANEQY